MVLLLIVVSVLLFILAVSWLMYANSDPEEMDELSSSESLPDYVPDLLLDPVPAEPDAEATPVPSRRRRRSGVSFSIGDSEDGEPPAVVTVSAASQCDLLASPVDVPAEEPEVRALRDLVRLLVGDRPSALRQMSDAEVLKLLDARELKAYQLEKELGRPEEAVRIRRKYLGLLMQRGDGALDGIPTVGLDYGLVLNACAENVIGAIPIPLGYAGPLKVNGGQIFLPMATTEGCLIASTHRGCLAIAKGNGVRSVVLKDGMTRAAVVKFPCLDDTAKFIQWTEKSENIRFMKQKFDEGSRFARLNSVTCNAGSGRLVFIRFEAKTGDAMGMNMVSKGTEAVVKMLADVYFPAMSIVSLSGNYCVDKKPAAINWISGRGKSVVAEAVVPSWAVESILKTTPKAMVELAKSKNLVGSALAGTLGGFNAHAANVVTAVFLATGQDVAQNVSSSNCLTTMEEEPNGDLYAAVKMPSLEVGTVGGGTILPPQAAALELLGCRGGDPELAGRKAGRLAEILAAGVLAGELSLLAALSSGDLVRSHLRHNRSVQRLRGSESETQPACGLGSFTTDLASLSQQSLKGTSLSPDTCSKVLT